MKVFISEKANRDLLSIYSYIEKRNPTAAEAILRRIDEKFEQISGFPSSGANGPALLRAFAALS
jgi:plasmid stabilization system protein ParE